MAPAEMRLMAAMARHRPVFLYVPDPSAKYWGDAAGNGSRQALADQSAVVAQGRAAVDQAITAAAGGAVEKSVVTPALLVTKDNIDTVDLSSVVAPADYRP